ncbi:MAG: site-2 protease family protein [Clostridia bacterium]|nr:site-2 protease family protein [Clostridia bacterium]
MAFITAMLATDKTGFMLPTLFAVLMHEFGHLFIMWVLDCTPKKIKLIPASVQIVNSFSRGYKNDILIALSGPCVNLLLFSVLYYNYLCFKNEFTLYFALLNLLIGVFNLLPVKGLDGGTILFSLLCKFTDINRAVLIVKLITAIFALAVIITAVLLTIGGKLNASLYIIGIYLLIMCLIKI